MTGEVEVCDIALGPGAVGLRLDRALADAMPELSRERVKSLIKDGRVAVRGGGPIASAAEKVAAPLDLIVTLPPPAPLDTMAQDMDLVIAFEDEHLIVVDKPAGMVVHPANGNPDGTLVNALLHHCAGQLSGIGGVARPGIVHRIDKDTSGLIVAAKSDRAHEGLARQFAAHSIDRRYIAVAGGRVLPADGRIEASLGRSNHDRKKMAVVEAGRGKHAVTHYRTIEPLDGATLIECRLETGRTHQVRVHMAHIGHALLGDPAYARPGKAMADRLRAMGFQRQALHAARLGFIHPITTNEVAFNSDLPTDMRELCSALRIR